jgi:hypothetical protein
VVAAGGAPRQSRKAGHRLRPRTGIVLQIRQVQLYLQNMYAQEIAPCTTNERASIGAVSLPDAHRVVRLSVVAGRAILALAVVGVAATQCLASVGRAGRLRRQSVSSAGSTRQFGINQVILTKFIN